MKTVKLYAIPFFSLIFFFSACEDQGDPVSPVVTPPTLQSIVPDSAAIGDTVTINGKKFGATRGTSSVNFGSVAATVFVSWNDSTIRVKVPASSTTGNVTVKVNGATSAGKQFKVIGTVSLISFASDIQPIITDYNCASCHGGGSTFNNFNITSYSNLMLGNSLNGPVVVPGNGLNSHIVKRLQGTVSPRMPQGGPFLTTPEIQKFIDWIDQGAQNN